MINLSEKCECWDNKFSGHLAISNLALTGSLGYLL